MEREPHVDVGIADRRPEIKGRLKGSFTCGSFVATNVDFSVSVEGNSLVVDFSSGQRLEQQSRLMIEPVLRSTFALFDVRIGRQFHWERPEDQEFRGSLALISHDDGTMTAVNRVPVEEYLKSVVSSEMSARSPLEFLKTHAILSRSWLLSLTGRRVNGAKRQVISTKNPGNEVVRWYDHEDHEEFDVCSDDHCQRYHGITKITSPEVEEAVEATRGMVLAHEGAICDARYSKACGGLTEVFSSAWDDRDIPYLRSVADDGAGDVGPISSEEEAEKWIKSEPDAFCNVRNPELLSRVLPNFDRETTAFFRWTVEYTVKELSRLVREKSGIDFGDIRDLIPLNRGPSGRISRLKIVGSKVTVVVGKELEIRRWLSKSHLYSSAFVVHMTLNSQGGPKLFTFHGAGWGHGVGLCQIGAASMADQGFSAEAILKHYFVGTDITRIYF
jgi:stage II sporulation protein D